MRGLLVLFLCVAPAAIVHAQESALESEAWAAFLDDRLEPAASAYARLVDRLPPSSARDEALVMLAAIFADLDWDRDGVVDAESPRARITRLVGDRPWLGALVYATAHALHLSSHDPAAIALAAYARDTWPPPESGGALAAACLRHRARPESLHTELPAERAAADATCARFGL